MIRRIRNLLLPLFLLVCASAILAGTWVRDARGGWSLDWRLGGWEYSVNGSDGQLRVGRQRGLPRLDGTRVLSQPRMRIDAAYPNWASIRTGSQDFINAGIVYRQRFATVELSAKLIITGGATAGVLALATAALRRTRKRRRDGSCPKCAYDLTANTSGVCPECGTPVAEKAST